jgi:hypothetical protein
MSQPIHEEELKEKRKRLENANLPLLHTETLMEIFDFDENALNTNRRNFVTKAQGDIIILQLKGEADSMWLMLTIMIGTGVVLALIFATQGLPTLYLLMGLAVVVLPMLWYAYSRQGGLRKDMQRLRAFSIDGRPALRMGLRGNQEMYLNIGNQSIPITMQQARALGEFSLPMLRVYYAEHSKQLLSAEVLIDEKIKNEDLDEQAYYAASRDYAESEE